MVTISTTAHVGADGNLTLQLPDDLRDADVDVTLQVRKSEENPWDGVPRDANGWPIGFFEATAGCWAGEPLERAPQGEYEVREELL